MKKNMWDQYRTEARNKLKSMSQIDISSYSAIIFWSFLVFICGFLYLYSFNLPNFVFETRKDKLKNITILSFFLKINEIKNNNEFFFITQLKNLIQRIK